MSEEMEQPMQMDELPELRRLAVEAPQSAFLRFRRRAGLLQGGRLLVDSQVTGFWLVLDTLLKRIFRALPLEEDPATTQQPNVQEYSTGENA